MDSPDRVLTPTAEKEVQSPRPFSALTQKYPDKFNAKEIEPIDLHTIQSASEALAVARERYPDAPPFAVTLKKEAGQTTGLSAYFVNKNSDGSFMIDHHPKDISGARSVARKSNGREPKNHQSATISTPEETLAFNTVDYPGTQYETQQNRIRFVHAGPSKWQKEFLFDLSVDDIQAILDDLAIDVERMARAIDKTTNSEQKDKLLNQRRGVLETKEMVEAALKSKATAATPS